MSRAEDSRPAQQTYGVAQNSGRRNTGHAIKRFFTWKFSFVIGWTESECLQIGASLCKVRVTCFYIFLVLTNRFGVCDTYKPKLWH